MGIVNAGQLEIYDEIDKDLLECVEDVLFDRREDATERLLDYAESVKGQPPKVTFESIDKQLVGQVAAKLRSLRPPEPYKGKGIKYVGEQLRRKAGKTAAK